MNTPLSKTPKSRLNKPYDRRRSSPACFKPFKSPAVNSTPSGSKVKSKDKVSLAKDLLALRDEIEKTEEEINELKEEYCESELQIHIDKLHEYNEIKDVAQMLIGKLAEVKGTTTKSLYTDFDLEMDD